jgi:hypothetical protein
MMSPPDALRDIESTMADLLALSRGIDASRIRVTLTPRERDGKPGQPALRIDVTIDGQADDDAEQYVVKALGIADAAAVKIARLA